MSRVKVKPKLVIYVCLFFDNVNIVLLLFQCCPTCLRLCHMLRHIVLMEGILEVKILRV